MVAHAPQAFLDFLQELTIVLTKGVGLLLGISADSNGSILTVNGFEMEIITECTAVHYVVILASAMILYPAHPLSYRLAGIMASTGAVLTANAVRLIITGVIGSISWSAFIIFHDYLWLASFTLVVLGIWYVWVNRRLSLDMEMAKKAGIVVFACAITYSVLILLMPVYGRLVASTAAFVYRAFLADPAAAIWFDGSRMQYWHAGVTFSASYAADLMVVALYVGLCLSSGDLGRGKIWRYLPGLSLIIAISILIIPVAGLLNVKVSQPAAVLFLWGGDGLLIVLAMLSYMLMSQRTIKGDAGVR